MRRRQELAANYKHSGARADPPTRRARRRQTMRIAGWRVGDMEKREA